jgi:vancomycin permeability regulator SanA
LAGKIPFKKKKIELRKFIVMFFNLILILLIIGVLILGIPRLITGLYSNPRITSVSEASPERAAIVFGAGLRRDGTPTTILRDRVETAVALYNQGKVEKLLFSGDNSFLDYNEPGSMKEYALSFGVPEKDIILDFAGRRTYDTCYRAKEIFGLQKALLVTQPYHLPRAVFTCNILGLESSGVYADNYPYRKLSLGFWTLRELPATLVALWELFITKPTPILGNKEPIF